MTNAAQPPRLGLAHACVDTSTATPQAPDYGDVYFSADDGLGESRHVFIDGNKLCDRLAAWREKRPFVIGETGFGTGRNMLLAWQMFTAVAPADARLHIVSFERHPLTADDLDRIWAPQPQLCVYVHRLINLWPDPVRGTHRLHLSNRVTLDLVFDNIETGLAGFDGQIDIWFLDGFAPARNPAMWSQDVFHALAAASRPGATFATYSCARMVRDHASSAGFAWHKQPGHGRKRDMLCGQLSDDPRQPANAAIANVAAKGSRQPWFKPPTSTQTGRIAIIGAGIAGATVAEALARRGRACDVYDPHGGPGGASGNVQAALYIRPAANGDTRTRFQLAALSYTLRWLADVDPTRELWSDCGLLQLACNADESRRQRRCIQQLGLPAATVRPVATPAAAKLAAMPLGANVHGGLFYPRAGWVHPAALCRQLLQSDGVTIHPVAVTGFKRHADGWHVRTADGSTADYAHVILACAQHAAQLTRELPPLTAVRGQISAFTHDTTMPTPACIVCGHGQVMPPTGGRVRVGASFIANTNDTTPRASEDAANINLLAEFAPALALQLQQQPSQSRVALRCSGYNHLPYVGPVPDAQAWRRDYAALALDARRTINTPPIYQTGLWASLAHGGSGMVSAPLAAEILASRLCDEPMPLAADVIGAVHPGRWLIRELSRGQ